MPKKTIQIPMTRTLGREPKMIKKKPDAIFFDWDGTLIDSKEAIQGYLNHVLGHFGKPLLSLEEACKATRKSARETYPQVFGEKSDEALQLLYKHVAETHLSTLKPFEGAEEFLDKLHHAQIPMAVVSNKHHPNLLREVSYLGWDVYLTENVGAGEAERDKPSPDPLLLSAKRKGLDPSKHELWYVGDTETDMKAALGAGFRPFFIEHGMEKREDVLHFPQLPVFVQDFQAFVRILTQIL